MNRCRSVFFSSRKAEERQKVRGSQPAGHFARMINISWSAFVTVSVSQRIGPRRRPPKRASASSLQQKQIIIASPYRRCIYEYMEIKYSYGSLTILYLSGKRQGSTCTTRIDGTPVEGWREPGTSPVVQPKRAPAAAAVQARPAPIKASIIVNNNTQF